MLSRKQSQFYSSYCGSSEKVITLALQASIASSNLVSRTKSHTFYPLKLVGQSMAWLSHARWTTILKSMKDCQQAVCLAPSWLTHTCQCSRHELTDGKQPSHVKRQTKSGVYGCFFSPPFSCSASLCEQLLAGGSGETPAYSLLGILLNVWIYTVFSCLNICVLPFAQTPVRRGKSLDSLNVCRITFYLNFCREVIWSYWFECMSHYLLLKLKHEGIKVEYMSYYLLFKLNCRMGVSSIVWIYVVLPFAQTLTTFLGLLPCLNICRITFCSNFTIRRLFPFWFEYMSYYLLLKLDRKSVV